MDFQQTIEPEINEEKSKKIVNQSTKFTVLSDKNNEYTIIFENKLKILSISSKNNDDNNFNQKFIYKNNFSLNDIQKVKWFLAYNSIDDCLLEIFNILNEKKIILKEEKDKLILIIPLNSIKYPEIIFPLLKKERSDSEKINELYDIINEQQKQINVLKENLDSFMNQEIVINEAKTEINGIDVDLELFGKEDFNKYLEKEYDSKNSILRLDLSLKKNDKIKEILNEIKEEFNKDEGGLIIIKENHIIIFLDLEINENNFIMSTFFKEFINIKGNLKSEFEIKDIFETEAFKDLLPKLLNINLVFKGMTINSKLILREIIKEIIIEPNNEILKDTTLLKILQNFINRLLFKKTYLSIDEYEFNAYDEIVKLSTINSIDIEKKFSEFKKSKISILNEFNKEKELLLFENTDFNDLSMSFLFKLVEFGINIHIKSKTLDDIKNDLILKRKVEIKKETVEKEKEDIVEKNNNENNNNQENNNINEIVNEFRKDFNLSEDEYPNEVLINKLKKYNYDKVKTFESLFD